MNSGTTRKAAIAVLCMSEEAATEVCRYLNEDQLRALAAAISTLGTVSTEEKVSVCRELSAQAEHRGGDLDGLAYIRRIIERVAGPTKASSILDCHDIGKAPFSFAADIAPPQLAALLENEHPQTIALVLRHLRPETAAHVISGLPPELQVEVIRRIAATNEISIEAVCHVETAIRRLLGNSNDDWNQTTSGFDSVVAIFRNLDRRSERSIIDALSEAAPELADEISGALFSFEHIFELDDRAIQSVLRHLDAHQIALAIKGAQDDHVEKIMRNLSERAAANLKEELEMLGRVRRKDVDAAQDAFVRTVLELADAGELAIDDSEEEYIE